MLTGTKYTKRPLKNKYMPLNNEIYFTSAIFIGNTLQMSLGCNSANLGNRKSRGFFSLIFVNWINIDSSQHDLPR